MERAQQTRLCADSSWGHGPTWSLDILVLNLFYLQLLISTLAFTCKAPASRFPVSLGVNREWDLKVMQSVKSTTYFITNYC